MHTLKDGSNRQDVIWSLNRLVQACHQQQLRNNWWGTPGSIQSLKENALLAPTKIALAHSELSESLEGFRKNIPDDHIPRFPAAAVELIDTIVRCCDILGKMASEGMIDPDESPGVIMWEKLLYNDTRADHTLEHRENGGKKF